MTAPAPIRAALLAGFALALTAVPTLAPAKSQFTLQDAISEDGSEPVPSTPFVSGSEGYHTFRIPALVVNGAGHLLAICEGRKRGGGDSGDIDTVSKLSRDGDKTWSKLSALGHKFGDVF